MALVKIDKTHELFGTSDVLTYESFGSTYALKLLKRIFIDEVGEYRWISQVGKIVENEFVAYSLAELKLYTIKSLRYDYDSKWTKDVHKPYPAGSVLKDQDGVFYLVASEARVWNLDRGTQTTQERWETAGVPWGGRKFTEVKTAAAKSFADVLDLKAKW